MYDFMHVKMNSRMSTELKEFLVRESFDMKGFELIGQYRNASKIISFLCNKGHSTTLWWNNFRKSPLCPECIGSKVSRSTKEKFYASQGYKLLESSSKKDSFTCTNNHLGAMKWGNFRIGHRCRKCSHINSPTQETVSNAFRERGWILLDTYTNAHTKMKFICSKGHKYKITWSNFRFGCGKCRSKKYEEHAAKVLDDLGIVYVREWSEVKPFKVDFYLPDHDTLLEIDERHHKRQVQRDLERQFTITQSTGKQFERIDATKGFNHITNKLMELLQ